MWIKNVTREVTIFPADGVTRSFGGTGKAFGIPFNYEHIIFADNTWWYKEDDYRSIKTIFQKKVEENPRYVSTIVEKQRKCGEALKDYVKEISGRRYSKDDFLKEIKVYDQRMTEFYSFWWMAIPAGEVLEEKIKNILSSRKTDILFEDLLFSPKELELMRESRLLINLASKIEKYNNFSDLPVEIKKSFENHTEEFSWINTSYHIGDPVSAEDFFKKAKSIDSAEELQKIEDDKNKQKQILSSLTNILSENEMLFVNAMHEIMYLRNYQKETVNECQHRSEPFLLQGSSFLNLTLQDFLCLSPNEVFDELNKEKPDHEMLKKKISERKVKFAIIFKDGKSEIVTDTSAILAEVHGEERTDATSEIKGFTARKGKVRGIARIVLNKEELKLFKKGEVLVTIMTTVDYIQKMKEAAAIVTDEGGITCHAAIFSREFGIPCVIGTKNTTKIIKNGDMIEVDADTGVVRIIK